MPSHFEDQDALSHVVQKRAEGIVELSESHGTELPGHLAAGADTAIEMALLLFLAWLAFPALFWPLAAAWVVWKTGRSARLGWARLERLHRVIEQEKYEIEHHRQQEREELTVLYRAKGFEGKLLEEVIDTLMADQDRLLTVMLEEELGLTLRAYEHPLKQAVGALIGGLLSTAVCGIFFWLFPTFGMLIASPLLIGCAAAFGAKTQQNRVIHAIVWTLAVGILAVGVFYFFGNA